MKARANPKVWLKHKIYDKRIEIGYLQLVSYLTGDNVPHIEFEIDEEYRGKGVMRKELPKYLKIMKKWDFTKAIAVVKEDNAASRRLLENNGFIELVTIGNKVNYVIDLKLTEEVLRKTRAAMDKAFNWEKYE